MYVKIFLSWETVPYTRFLGKGGKTKNKSQTLFEKHVESIVRHPVQQNSCPPLLFVLGGGGAMSEVGRGGMVLSDAPLPKID